MDSETSRENFVTLIDSKKVIKGVQWSAVRVTAVSVTVGYSDSFGNPRFIANKTPLLTVT